MAEAFVSLLIDRFDEVLVEQAKNEMNLVKGAHSQIDNIIYQLKLVRPDLNDAENRRQNKEEAVKEWLDEVENTLYEMEDKVDDWNIVILLKRIKEDSYSGNQSKLWRAPRSLSKSIVLRWNRCLIERKMKKMNRRLDSLVKMKDQFGFGVTESRPFRVLQDDSVAQTLFVDPGGVHGQDDSKEHLIQLILQNEETTDHMKVISIVGMGGVGKTTIAQLLYNDSRVVNYFDARAWVCVGQRVSVIRILREILRSMNIYSSSSYKNESEDSLSNLLRSSVSQKRYLLVLDDLWEADVCYKVIHQLLNDASECAIPITTRSMSVAKHMRSKYVHHVSLVTEEESWALFQSIALAHTKSEEFKEIGRAIVREANGLPLIIKCIGGMLRSKQLLEEWMSVLFKLQDLNRQPLDGLHNVLTIAYQDLPTALKRCFCYCLIFPYDVQIDADKLLRMWLAHGYLGSTGNDDRVEQRGLEFVKELVKRHFFKASVTDDDGKIMSFRIHDILHDLAAHYYQLQFRMVDYINNETLNLLSQRTCRHLTILSSCQAPLFPHSSSANSSIARLRTLFAPEFDQQVLQADLFPQLSYLRVLSFCDGNLKLLPKEIGKLIYLRYLDLSGNPLEVLPEYICRLCNLETLDLQDCILLKKLPLGIGKLIMLRHLLTRNTPRLQCFPEGLEKLTMLRTLDKFMVGKQFNKLRYLKNLNNLEGTLELEFYELDGDETITDAEDVVSNAEDVVSDAEDDLSNAEDDLSDAGDDVSDVEDDLSDAKQANLKDKRYLTELKLTFNKEVSNEVFEALEAPVNLQRLHIYGLRNNIWPNWISEPQNQLRELKINFCTKCLSLPPLWGLPFLETLDIDAMMAMRNVCLREFLGIGRSIDRETIEGIDSGTEVAPSNTVIVDSGTHGSTEVAPSDTNGSKEVDDSGIQGSTEAAPSDTKLSKEVADPDTVVANSGIVHSDTVVADSGTQDSIEVGDSGTEVAHSSTVVTDSGTQDNTESTEVVPSSPSSRIAFPMLKKLRFNFCIGWDNWEDITEQGETEENDVSILPSLLELEVSRCEMLKALPHQLLRRISTLRSLKIGYCSQLSKLYKNNEQRAKLPMNITTIVPTLVAGELESEIPLQSKSSIATISQNSVRMERKRTEEMSPERSYMEDID